MNGSDPKPSARRRFLTQLSGGIAALAGLSTTAAAKQAATLANPEHDAWMQRAQGEHRQLFHSTAPGDGAAMLMATNFLDVYGADYGAAAGSVSAVIGVHGTALPIGLNDAAWNKYELGKRINATDPDTKEHAKRNIFATGGRYSIDTAINRGIVLLVCNVALKLTAGSLARARSLPEADVYAELRQSIIPGAVVVPSLVVAISRAQEKGFTYVRAS